MDSQEAARPRPEPWACEVDTSSGTAPQQNFRRRGVVALGLSLVVAALMACSSDGGTRLTWDESLLQATISDVTAMSHAMSAVQAAKLAIAQSHNGGASVGIPASFAAKSNYLANQKPLTYVGPASYYGHAVSPVVNAATVYPGSPALPPSYRLVTGASGPGNSIVPSLQRARSTFFSNPWGWHYNGLGQVVHSSGVVPTYASTPVASPAITASGYSPLVTRTAVSPVVAQAHSPWVSARVPTMPSLQLPVAAPSAVSVQSPYTQIPTVPSFTLQQAPIRNLVHFGAPSGVYQFPQAPMISIAKTTKQKKATGEVVADASKATEAAQAAMTSANHPKELGEVSESETVDNSAPTEAAASVVSTNQGGATSKTDQKVEGEASNEAVVPDEAERSDDSAGEEDGHTAMESEDGSVLGTRHQQLSSLPGLQTTVVVPPGHSPGDFFSAKAGEERRQFLVQVPAGAYPGDVLKLQRVPAQTGMELEWVKETGSHQSEHLGVARNA